MTKPRGGAVPLASGSIEIPATERECYVYRAYCKCGDVLYVGMTNDLFERLTGHKDGSQWAGHRRGAPWERQMVRLEWDLYSTRAIAATVEARLILELAPVHNVIGARRGQPKPLPWPTFPSGAERELRFLKRIRPQLLGDRL